MNKNRILLFLRENKTELKKRFNITRIGLFGSYAKGFEEEISDIDIIVDGRNIKDTELKDFLEDKFHKKVDIVKESNLYYFMKYLINKEAIYV
ncbi:MAG: nucleotidyltransferase domain-containing protein [Bacteroidetes bacterium]|nr:nucleotidyltransferase domain-containing protein [Bacteroidota bacterium]